MSQRKMSPQDLESWIQSTGRIRVPGGNQPSYVMTTVETVNEFFKLHLCVALVGCFIVEIPPDELKVTFEFLENQVTHNHDELRRYLRCLGGRDFLEAAWSRHGHNVSITIHLGKPRALWKFAIPGDADCRNAPKRHGELLVSHCLIVFTGQAVPNPYGPALILY